MSGTIPPDAFVMIIGAMKCGTSSLYELLGQHPEICTSKVKEPEFFSENQKHGSKVEKYEMLFDYDSEQHVYCLEASTGYTKYPYEERVVDRIRASQINPRFIYAVRDPIDRIESQYNYGNVRQVRWRTESILSPENINLSRYHTQLGRYLKHYPDKKRYFIADFDELVNAPADLAKQIFQWLNVKPITVSDTKPANVTPSPSVLESRIKASMLGKLKHYIPQRAKDAIRSILRPFGPTAKVTLTSEEREKVRMLIHEDIIRFGSEFDFDVKKWGFHAT